MAHSGPLGDPRGEAEGGAFSSPAKSHVRRGSSAQWALLGGAKVMGKGPVFKSGCFQLRVPGQAPAFFLCLSFPIRMEVRITTPHTSQPL